MVTSVLYHPIFLSTRQLARSGEKYLWSSLQHSDEREAAFEGGRPVDGAIEKVVSVAVVAIAIPLALSVCLACLANWLILLSATGNADTRWPFGMGR